MFLTGLRRRTPVKHPAGFNGEKDRVVRGHRRLRHEIATGVAVLALAVAGCTSPNSSGAGSTAPKSGAVYTMGDYIIPAQMANMNPLLLTGNWVNLFRYMYDSLYYFNPVSGKLEPDLATGTGTWSSDHLTYTIKLNSKATWQDGKPVTAADVTYTYNLLKQYPQADQYGLWQYLSGVSGSGDTVEFTTTKPFPGLPDLLSEVYVLPQHIWASAGNPIDNQNMKPVGSGAFTFDSYQSGVAINLKANPNYFLGKPSIGKLVIEMYSSANAVTLALEKGTINTTTGTIAMPSLPLLLKTTTNKLQKYPGLQTFGVILNTKQPPLDDVNVRQAIQRAINQQALIDQGELGGVFNANAGWLSPVFPADLNSAVYKNAAYGYDVTAAKQLLQKAGYTFDGQGMAAKNGQKLSLTYYEASGAPAQEKEASMIQDSLKSVGITVTPKLATWPELTKILAAGDFQLVQDGITSPPAPVLSMSSVFESRNTAPIGQNTPGLNYMRYENPQLDTILDEASQTFDASKEATMLKQAQKIIADDAPIAVMYNVGGHIVYRTDHFTGYDTNYPAWSPFGLLHVQAAG